jgi:hypothetical protein
MEHPTYSKYGKLNRCYTSEGYRSGNVVFPRYGETDLYVARYNQLMKYNQAMNVEAKVYEELLNSGMGPW